MTSAKMQAIERKLGVQRTPEKMPAPADDDLGVALQRLVDQRVKEALEQQQPVKQPAHVQRLMQSFNAPAPTTDFRQLPTVPKTAPAKNLSAQLIRDGAGLTRWIQIGNLKFEVQRDGADKVIGMHQVDESPVLPQPDIPKAEARKYNEGEPR